MSARINAEHRAHKLDAATEANLRRWGFERCVEHTPE